jgi:hypothetical protein
MTTKKYTSVIAGLASALLLAEGEQPGGRHRSSGSLPAVRGCECCDETYLSPK